MKAERNKTLKTNHPLYLPLLLLPAGAISLSQLLFAKGVAISRHGNFNSLNATVGGFGCGLPLPAADGDTCRNIGQITHTKTE